MRPVIVTIPACDEAVRIGACLAALAVQRDVAGAPLPVGAFAVLVYANNCGDGTADVVRHWSRCSPHAIDVVEERVPPGEASAGRARKRVMDLAADRLERDGHSDGLVLTTDADSIVSLTWVSATLQAVARGVDAVAGYVDAHPAEIVALGPAFLRRSRLEDRYLSAIAEIEALSDPRPHDPWPTHRVASGASLAVSLAAYRAIGGVPPVDLGEDAALVRQLECDGFKVRHAMDVVVSTSCRFDARAAGGAGDTMRERHADPDAGCDGGLDRANAIARRALLRGRLRYARETGVPPRSGWGEPFGIDAVAAARLGAMLPIVSFERAWERVIAASPVLAHRTPLRPDDLPGEIARAGLILARLRRLGQARSSRSSRYVPVSTTA